VKSGEDEAPCVRCTNLSPDGREQCRHYSFTDARHSELRSLLFACAEFTVLRLERSCRELKARLFILARARAFATTRDSVMTYIALVFVTKRKQERADRMLF
jgi:hypothetical protein